MSKLSYREINWLAQGGTSWPVGGGGGSLVSNRDSLMPDTLSNLFWKFYIGQPV